MRKQLVSKWQWAIVVLIAIALGIPAYRSISWYRLRKQCTDSIWTDTHPDKFQPITHDNVSHLQLLNYGWGNDFTFDSDGQYIAVQINLFPITHFEPTVYINALQQSCRDNNFWNSTVNDIAIDSYGIDGDLAGVSTDGEWLVLYDNEHSLVHKIQLKTGAMISSMPHTQWQAENIVIFSENTERYRFNNNRSLEIQIIAGQYESVVIVDQNSGEIVRELATDESDPCANCSSDYCGVSVPKALFDPTGKYIFAIIAPYCGSPNHYIAMWAAPNTD